MHNSHRYICTIYKMLATNKVGKKHEVAYEMLYVTKPVTYIC